MVGDRSNSLARARRVGRARERGMRSVGRLTRIAVAGSVALTTAFSAVAAIALSGRSNNSTSTSASTPADGPAGGARVAFPPTNSGGSLAPPVAPPISQPAAFAPVTSGGS